MIMKPQRRGNAINNLKYSRTVDRQQNVLDILIQRRVLAIDPGTVNCGVSVVEIQLKQRFNQETGVLRNGKPTLKVLHAGHIANPIASMNALDLHQQSFDFMTEIRALANQFEIDGTAAERFQTRGFGGSTIECVSAMLGALSTLPSAKFEIPVRTVPHNVKFKPMPTKLYALTAATWKNHFHKNHRVNLDMVYKRCKQRLRVTPHTVDATCIAIYTLMKGLGLNFKYSPTKLLTAYVETNDND